MISEAAASTSWWQKVTFIGPQMDKLLRGLGIKPLCISNFNLFNYKKYTNFLPDFTIGL